VRKLSYFLPFFLITVAAWACGDKLMLVMRVRLAQLKLGHPVSILAVTEKDLPSSALVRQIQLQPAVKKAGHKFQFLEDTSRLDEALKSDQYDVVLADVSLAGNVIEQVKSSRFRPVVLPVAYNTSKTEDSATQKKFHCLLRTPSGADQYFEAIDQALEWKAKSANR
jgi:hypothetical protein